MSTQSIKENTVRVFFFELHFIPITINTKRTMDVKSKKISKQPFIAEPALSHRILAKNSLLSK